MNTCAPWHIDYSPAMDTTVKICTFRVHANFASAHVLGCHYFPHRSLQCANWENRFLCCSLSSRSRGRAPSECAGSWGTRPKSRMQFSELTSPWGYALFLSFFQPRCLSCSHEASLAVTTHSIPSSSSSSDPPPPPPPPRFSPCMRYGSVGILALEFNVTILLP